MNIAYYFSFIKATNNEPNKHLLADDMATQQPSNLSLWVSLTPNVDSLSIIPSILSTLLVVLPSALILYCLVSKDKYELIGFLILANIVVHLFMYKCTHTNPGIIPQTLPNRERDPDLMLIPTKSYTDDELKYLIPNTTLHLFTKYCCECKIYRPARAIHCNSCNHCV
jgi:hypothetical protein